MESIKLIKAQPLHTQFLYDLYSDPSVLKGHGLHRPPAAVEWRNIITGLYEGFQHTFIINYGPLKAGHIGVQNFCREDRRAEIGIAISPCFQGKGIATEALATLMDTRIRAPIEAGGLGISVLLANIVEGNEASKKLFEGEDFRLLATLPSYHKQDGRRVGRWVYGWFAT